MDAEKILIHLRFAPDGTVVEIGERPQGASPQAWFNLLSEKAGNAYQTLSGGRGVFRLAADDLPALRAAYQPAGA